MLTSYNISQYKKIKLDQFTEKQQLALHK